MIGKTTENAAPCSKLLTADESAIQIVLPTTAFFSQLPSGSLAKSKQELSLSLQYEPQSENVKFNETSKCVDEKKDVIKIALKPQDSFVIYVSRSRNFLCIYSFEHALNKKNGLSEIENTTQPTCDPLQLLPAETALIGLHRNDQVAGQTVLYQDTFFDQLRNSSQPDNAHEYCQPERGIADKRSTYLDTELPVIRSYNGISSINKEVLEAYRMKFYIETASTTYRRNFDTTLLSLSSIVISYDLQDTSGFAMVPYGNRSVRLLTESVAQKYQLTWRQWPYFWITKSFPPLQRDDEVLTERSFEESHDCKFTELHNSKPSGVTQPIVHSSTDCVERENFQRSALELSAIDLPLTLELEGATQEAACEETAHDQDLFKRLVGLLFKTHSLFGCGNNSDLAFCNTEPLAVCVMSGRRKVGALERLAVTPANERDSAAHSIELFRLISFEKWPHFGKVSALTFSSAGFHYAGSSDTVTCHSCCLSLRGWSALAQPLDIHRQRSEGRCQLIGCPSLSLNVPLSSAAEAWSFSYDEALRAANLSAATEGTVMGTAASSSTSVAAASSYGTTSRSLTANNASTSGSEDINKQNAASRFLKDPTTTSRSSEREVSDAEHRQRQREELLKFESYRLRSYDGVWHYGHIVQPPNLAKSGFHYTGPGDRVQCAFCQGALRNWENGDRPEELHAKHFNYCRFVQGHDVGNVPIPFGSLAETTRTIFGDTSNIQGTAAPEGLGIFSSVPKHADFAVESRRLSTFATWSPSHPLRADSLAQAGFFFTGIGDNVTCFFCNGTVSGWNAESDPWLEHARRFSTCPYLLQVKGRDFVEKQSTLNASAPGLSTPKANFAVDPREIRARMDTPFVRIILKMDYPVDLVREVIQKRLSTMGRDYETSEELLADLFAIHDEKQRSTHAASDSKAAPVMPIVVSQPNAAGPATSSHPDRLVTATAASELVFGDTNFASAAETDRAPASMTLPQQPPDEENRQLKTQLTCKICMDAVVGIIFLPCGHLVSCAACASALPSCPICRVSVRGTARVTF